jgi:hypothetical protein
MRRFIYAALLSAMLCGSVGCLVPTYSGERPRRIQQLIFTSENMRAILNTWERVWFHEQPDHMTPQRVHGGVI